MSFKNPKNLNQIRYRRIIHGAFMENNSEVTEDTFFQKRNKITNHHYIFKIPLTQREGGLQTNQTTSFQLEKSGNPHVQIKIYILQIQKEIPYFNLIQNI
jgi:hypothetical protein